MLWMAATAATTTIGLTAALVWVWLRGPSDDDAQPAPAPDPPLAAARSVRPSGVASMLVFVTVDQGTADLDFVCVGGPRGGEPYAVSAWLPPNAAWAAPAERLLTRWASTGETLRLRAIRADGRSSVTITDGQMSFIRLELMGADVELPG